MDNDLISRQAGIDAIESYFDGLPIRARHDLIELTKRLPSAQPDIAEKLYQYKCYITDKEGLQHEVVHTGDIRRVTGWEI
jgi:hypothetical protein